MLVTDLDSRLTELYDEMVTLRRHFHQHPELSFEEQETPRTIATYLRELGLLSLIHISEPTRRS